METLGEMIAAALAPQEPSELDCWRVMAGHLAQHFAEAADVEASEAFASICELPDCMLPMLDSASGWGVLGSLIARFQGVDDPDLTPTLH